MSKLGISVWNAYLHMHNNIPSFCFITFLSDNVGGRASRMPEYKRYTCI